MHKIENEKWIMENEKWKMVRDLPVFERNSSILKRVNQYPQALGFAGKAG